MYYIDVQTAVDIFMSPIFLVQNILMYVKGDAEGLVFLCLRTVPSGPAMRACACTIVVHSNRSMISLTAATSHLAPQTPPEPRELG